MGEGSRGGASGPGAVDGADPSRAAALLRALLLLAGGVMLAAAVLYNRFTLAPLASDAFRPVTLERISGVQLVFAVGGLACLATAWAVGRWGRAIAGTRTVHVALLLLVGLLPVALLDLGLRPFVEPSTRLFVEDPELGWRLRPGAADAWGGVRVRVNPRGLRGPEVAAAKPPDATRILFLGDSVTFGYGIADDDALFPIRVGEALSASWNAPVEVVNAGVGGWAPWQQRIWLEREGLAYAPDLLVVGFVLNDVTEPLSLVRYGGTGRGWQLARSARSALDRWLSESALLTVARRGFAALRFGEDVQLGAARAEAVDVQRLAAGDPALERGWRVALRSLDALLDVAEARRIPALVVIFPYRFQLAAPERSAAPQRRLATHLRARGTPVLDLLPRFARHPSPASLMLDPSHLSAKGHALAADAIAERLRVLAGRAPESGG